MPRAGERRRSGRQFSGVLHTSEPISGPSSAVIGGGRGSSTDSGLCMWRNRGTCGPTPHSCGAICGTRRMSNFLPGIPCAPLGAGHRTLPPINQRLRPKRRSGIRQSEDPYHEATRGVGPVTGAAGSESLPGRGGRHPASSLEGLLVLIPSRGPHPLLPLGNRPCRFQGGDRVPAGLPEGTVPGRRRFAGGVGSPRSSRFAGSRSGPRPQPVRRRRNGTPGHRRLRPEVDRIRTTAGLPEVGRDPGQRQKLHTARQLAAPTR